MNIDARMDRFHVHEYPYCIYAVYPIQLNP